MVNTVGSYDTFRWQNKWIPIKNEILLTERQRSLIIGSLLGDGTMRMGEGAKNANFKTEQGLEQKEHVFWKYGILKSLVFTEPKISFRYRENKEKYPKSWWFRTVRHPLLTEIYDRFYTRDGFKAGKKIVPQDITKDLNSFSMAVWIMDDGSYNNEKIDISTYSFDLEEIGILQNTVKYNFEVDFKYYKDRDKGYRMYCNMKETKKLIKIIKPHIISLMKYKIGEVTP